MQYKSSIYLSLGALTIMALLYYLSNFGYLGDSPVGRTSVDTEPLIIPAGYAFSIWGIIYLGLIIFPIYQLIKKRTDSVLWHQLRIWFSLNVVANGLWLAFASYNWLWMTLGVIVFMLISLYKINELLIRINDSNAELDYWPERFVFSVYFGWVTLATVLNISAALNYYEWNGWGISEITWSLIIIPIAALITGAVVWKYRDIPYAGVVVWAFTALAVKQWGNIPILAYLSIAVIVIFLILIFARGRRPEVKTVA
jgi:hypothetical protein